MKQGLAIIKVGGWVNECEALYRFFGNGRLLGALILPRPFIDEWERAIDKLLERQGDQDGKQGGQP